MKILKFFGFDRRNRSPIQENKANPPSIMVVFMPMHARKVAGGKFYVYQSI